MYLSDRLKKILQDYKDKKINKYYVISYFRFIDKMRDIDYYRKTQLLMEKIIDEMQVLECYNNNPETILLEKIRYGKILTIIEKIKQILKPKQYDMLWLYVVEGWTQERIGKKYGVNQSAIARYLDRIYKKIQKNVIFLPENMLNREGFLTFDDLLMAEEKEADTPKLKIKYPFEYLSNLRDVNNKYICKLPQYFRESFGDDKTVCTLCTNDYGENHCIYKDVKT